MEPGWHPSSNACYGCARLGYEKNPASNKLIHICTVSGKPPFGMESCPLGTGPVKVTCNFWGVDTLCHNTQAFDCSTAEKARFNCPLPPFGCSEVTPALDLMRRQAGRNLQTGNLTTEFCRKKDCKHLQKRAMNKNLECGIAGRIPGNMKICPKEAS